MRAASSLPDIASMWYTAGGAAYTQHQASCLLCSPPGCGRRMLVSGHTYTHARTHARTHTHAHAHAHAEALADDAQHTRKHARTHARTHTYIWRRSRMMRRSGGLMRWKHACVCLCQQVSFLVPSRSLLGSMRWKHARICRVSFSFGVYQVSSGCRSTPEVSVPCVRRLRVRGCMPTIV